MIVAALGGVVGVIVIGAINSDDDSPSGRRSSYQDAQLLAEIDEQRIYLEEKEKEERRLKKSINNKLQTELQDLINNPEIGNIIQARGMKNPSMEEFDSLAESTRQDLKNSLEKVIQEDRQHLKDIDDVIRKINEIELMNKE